jgi:hypothetical protein
MKTKIPKVLTCFVFLTAGVMIVGCGRPSDTTSAPSGIEDSVQTNTERAAMQSTSKNSGLEGGNTRIEGVEWSSHKEQRESISRVAKEVGGIVGANLQESQEVLALSVGEAFQHFEEAKKLKHEFSGKSFSTVPVSNGKLTYQLTGSDDRILEVKKFTPANALMYTLSFYPGGTLKEFRLANDSDDLKFYPSGSIKFYGKKRGEVYYESTWSEDGILERTREFGTDKVWRITSKPPSGL